MKPGRFGRGRTKRWGETERALQHVALKLGNEEHGRTGKTPNKRNEIRPKKKQFGDRETTGPNTASEGRVIKQTGGGVGGRGGARGAGGGGKWRNGTRGAVLKSVTLASFLAARRCRPYPSRLKHRRIHHALTNSLSTNGDGEGERERERNKSNGIQRVPVERFLHRQFETTGWLSLIPWLLP